MGQKPCGFVGDAENAVQLVAADALLAGHHQMDGLQPQMQRQVAFLEDRAFANRELLAALAALPKAMAFFALGVLYGWLGANACQGDKRYPQRHSAGRLDRQPKASLQRERKRLLHRACMGRKERTLR